MTGTIGCNLIDRLLLEQDTHNEKLLSTFNDRHRLHCIVWLRQF